MEDGRTDYRVCWMVHLKEGRKWMEYGWMTDCDGRVGYRDKKCGFAGFWEEVR